MRFVLSFIAVAFIPWLIISMIFLFLSWTVTATAISIALTVAVSYFFYWSRRLEKPSEGRDARRYYFLSAVNLVFLAAGLLLSAYILPGMAARLSASSDEKISGQLAAVRRSVEEYRLKTGSYPKRLEEMGPVPPISIYSVHEKTGLLHYHAPSSLVSIIRTGSVEQIYDEGHWAYNPDTGHVFIACRGRGIQLRRPMYWY